VVKGKMLFAADFC